MSFYKQIQLSESQDSDDRQEGLSMNVKRASSKCLTRRSGNAAHFGAEPTSPAGVQQINANADRQPISEEVPRTSSAMASTLQLPIAPRNPYSSGEQAVGLPEAGNPLAIELGFASGSDDSSNRSDSDLSATEDDPHHQLIRSARFRWEVPALGQMTRFLMLPHRCKTERLG